MPFQLPRYRPQHQIPKVISSLYDNLSFETELGYFEHGIFVEMNYDSILVLLIIQGM